MVRKEGVEPSPQVSGTCTLPLRYILIWLTIYTNMNRKYLRQLIRECLHEVLNESVTVSVSGAHQEFPDLATVHDIAWAIMHKSLQPLERLSGDQKEFFQQNRVPEILAPDGNDFDKPTGILNFYIAGIPNDTVLEMIKLIKQQLDNMGIEYGRFKGEQSGMYKSKVIRIPILKNPWSESERVPELNMANRNYMVLFRDVLKLVGDDDWSFSFPVETVEKALQPFLKGTDTSQMQQLEPYTINPSQREVEPRLPGDEWKPETPDDAILQALGGKGYDMGLSIDQLTRYIIQLNNIVQWAKLKGFKTISGG